MLTCCLTLWSPAFFRFGLKNKYSIIMTIKNFDESSLMIFAIKAALNAGKKVLEIYDKQFDVVMKDDKSPLTVADLQSNEIIMEYLNKTGIPVLSEEGKIIPYSERKNWNRLWIVDPLDGTKEFIKRNGEFTVNIALVQNRKPVLGVIYSPVLDQIYFGAEHLKSSFKIENVSENIFNIKNPDFLKHAVHIPLDIKNKKPVFALSRSHINETTKKFIENFIRKHGEIKYISKGSALKLCMIAEGSADIYPRFAPTYEWDTAAGHAIINYAEGKLINTETHLPLIYNKEDLLNQGFIAINKNYSS